MKKKLSKIKAEVLEFFIYFGVFNFLGILLILTPTRSYVDNFITYIMGVFSVLLLLQMAYIEKLIKDKKKKENNIQNENVM